MKNSILLLRRYLPYVAAGVLALTASAVIATPAQAKPKPVPKLEAGGLLVSVFGQPQWCVQAGGHQTIATLQACDQANPNQLWSYNCNGTDAQKFAYNGSTSAINHTPSG